MPKPDEGLPPAVEALQKTRRTTRIPTTGDRDALLAAVRSNPTLRALPELEQALARLERDRNDPFALQALCAALVSSADRFEPVRRQLEPFVQLPPAEAKP